MNTSRYFKDSKLKRLGTRMLLDPPTTCSSLRCRSAKAAAWSKGIHVADPEGTMTPSTKLVAVCGRFSGGLCGVFVMRLRRFEVFVQGIYSGFPLCPKMPKT